MKVWLVRKWGGDSWGHGDWDLIGVCFTVEAAEFFAKQQHGTTEELEVLDLLKPSIVEGYTKLLDEEKKG